MSEANKALARRWFQEVWNDGNEATIDELANDDTVAHGLAESDIDTIGMAEFKVFHRQMLNNIGGLHIELEDVIAEGDQVAVRLLLTGVHAGGGMGVAATGNRIRIAGIVTMRIKDGQIVEAYNSWDQLGLLRQIGALPAIARHEDRFLTQSA